MVMVGGELTLEPAGAELQLDDRVLSGPVQAVANGGVLVIDDFGCQHCSPRDLLNRWIVPLESRVDFLTLQTGQKFELPFMTLIVFATNIRPAELVDEAFLRRIQHRRRRVPPSRTSSRSSRAAAASSAPPPNPASRDSCCRSIYRPSEDRAAGLPPRDPIRQALSLASYLNRPAHVTMDLLEAACNSYFVDDREEPAVHA